MSVCLHMTTGLGSSMGILALYRLFGGANRLKTATSLCNFSRPSPTDGLVENKVKQRPDKREI